MLQLPPRASLLHGIPELNSPRRIYDEWMNLSKEISVPNVPSSKKYPKPDEMDQLFATMSNDITRDIKNPSTTPSNLTTTIFQAAQKINSILDNYSNLMDLPVITSRTQGPGGAQLKGAADALQLANANAVVTLRQYTSHVEILANANIPMRKYWDILVRMNNIFFTFIKEYVNKLRMLFQCIPYDSVMSQVGESTTPPPTRILGTMIQPILPRAQSHPNENPLITSLHQSLEELVIFAFTLPTKGYTWKGTCIQKEDIDKCCGLARKVKSSFGIVEKMFDIYEALPGERKIKVTDYQPQFITSAMETARTNINILLFISNKFTMGSVYETATTCAKQISMLVKELRSLVEGAETSAPRPPSSSACPYASAGSQASASCVAESNPYEDIEDQPAPQMMPQKPSMYQSPPMQQPQMYQQRPMQQPHMYQAPQQQMYQQRPMQQPQMHQSPPMQQPQMYQSPPMQQPQMYQAPQQQMQQPRQNQPQGLKFNSNRQGPQQPQKTYQQPNQPSNGEPSYPDIDALF
jgi:hypothetical protein